MIRYTHRITLENEESTVKRTVLGLYGRVSVSCSHRVCCTAGVESCIFSQNERFTPPEMRLRARMRKPLIPRES